MSGKSSPIKARKHAVDQPSLSPNQPRSIPKWRETVSSPDRSLQCKPGAGLRLFRKKDIGEWLVNLLETLIS